MLLSNNNVTQLTRYYIGGQYEFDQALGSTKEKLYLGGDAYSAAAVYVRENSGSWQVSGKSAIGGFISGAIGGFAGGFITGFALSGGNFDKALSIAGQGAITGGVLGGYRGYKAAQNAGKDP